MAKEALFARDALVSDYVVLDARQTVAQGRNEMARTGAIYGVVVNAAGNPLALITAGALATIQDSDLRIEAVSMIPTFILDGETLLDQAVSFSAQTLVENPEMAGLIVEDQGKLVGVLSRQVIRKYAQRDKTRGGDITELAGVPQVRARYFVCPRQDYKKLIIRYDPDDPPTCPNHNLVLVEQP